MQYLGGKSRIAKEIAEIINCYSKDKTFVSLFCGACSVESKVIAKQYVLNDFHPYLVALLKAVKNGWNMPTEISKEEYYRVKNNQEENPALTAFVGFGCSFGGKWFGGYASNSDGLNYAKCTRNSLSKKMKNLKNADIHCGSYEQVEIPDGSVVYCDPPYKGTTGYSNSEHFDHKQFWDYIRKLSEKNVVFVSEVSAPDDFEVVWKKDLSRQLNHNDNFKSSEKLFVHKSQTQ